MRTVRHGDYIHNYILTRFLIHDLYLRLLYLFLEMIFRGGLPVAVEVNVIAKIKNGLRGVISRFLTH